MTTPREIAAGLRTTEQLFQELETSASDNRIQMAKEVAKTACVGVLGFIGGSIVGATLVPTETTLGPHRAEITLDTSGKADFDLGPVGSIVLPLSDSPWIGAHIRLKEVPLETASPVSGEVTSKDIDSYARFFTHFKRDVSDAKSDLLEHMFRFGLLGSASALAVNGVFDIRRRRLFEHETDSTLTHKLLRIGLAVSLLGGAVGVMAEPGGAGESLPVNAVFEGTPLEQARVRGKFLNALINEYGAQAIDYIQRNNDFYATAVSNLRLQMKASPNRMLTADNFGAPYIFWTDEHCNLGASSVIGEAVRQFRPRLGIDGGDVTFSGTELEGHCVRILRSEIGNLQVFVATGNHDSELTEEQLKHYGFTVLDGEPVEVDGRVILGDDDPRRSSFGESIRQEGSETIQQVGARLGHLSCEETVDILVVHDPKAIPDGISCAKLILDGHTHKEVLSFDSVSGQIRLVGGSVGGANQDRPTFGALTTPAKLYLISPDLKFYQRIMINTDASVEISPISRFLLLNA